MMTTHRISCKWQRPLFVSLLLLCLLLLPAAARAVEAEAGAGTNLATATDIDDWLADLAQNDPGDHTLTFVSDMEIDDVITVPSGIKLTVTGPGKTLLRKIGFIDKFFDVTNGGELTLTSITLDGNKQNITARDTLVVVAEGGTLNLQAGAVLKNNYQNKSDGGGIWSKGTIHMYEGAAISSNETNYHGGGVFIEAGVFYMHGGRIDNNSVVGDANGGGVAIRPQGTFHMHGGSITGNHTPSWGGGVIRGGPFIMDGGSITGNTAAGALDFNARAGNTATQFTRLSGDAVIGEAFIYCDNATPPVSAAFHLDGALSSDASIGIHGYGNPSPAPHNVVDQTVPGAPANPHSLTASDLAAFYVAAPFAVNSITYTGIAWDGAADGTFFLTQNSITPNTATLDRANPAPVSFTLGGTAAADLQPNGVLLNGNVLQQYSLVGDQLILARLPARKLPGRYTHTGAELQWLYFGGARRRRRAA